MGCGGSKVAAANEAIRTADNSQAAQELIASVDVTKKAKDGRIPFVEACKFGRTKMVRFMLGNDRKGRITKNTELVNEALRANCAGETQADLVQLLLQDAGSQPNYQVPPPTHLCACAVVVLVRGVLRDWLMMVVLDSVVRCVVQNAYGDSPLTLLASKNDFTTAEVLTQRRLAAVVLIEEGVDFGLPNGDGLTGLMVACRDGRCWKLTERWCLDRVALMHRYVNLYGINRERANGTVAR